MTQIEQILRALPGNIESFARCCNTAVSSSKLPEELDRGIELGQLLLRDIERTVLHLTTIKEKLENRVDIPE